MTVKEAIEVGNIAHTLTCTRCGATADMLETELGRMSLESTRGWSVMNQIAHCPKCADMGDLAPPAGDKP